MSSVAESLTDRTVRAAQWRFSSAFVGAVSQLAIGALLARLLTPADFGLMALAYVALGLARAMGDLGIGGAVVQRSVLTDRHVRTAFTFSVVLGLAIAAALALTAPLAAVIMRDPKATSLLRALAAGFVFGGAAVVPGALLRRRLDFRRQFSIETLSYVLGYGAVAVTLALLGYGVWSLVWGSLVQSLLSSGAQLLVVRHSFRPLLARRELGDLLHFGFGAQVSAGLNYLALNGDNFVVGRWIGLASLGLYSRAYTLMNLPHTYAATVMSSVLFPAFAQAQREPARLRRGYLLMTKLTALAAGPSMATMVIAAPHLVNSLYGSQWAGVVVPLQILCAVGYFRALYHVGGIVAQSVGWVYSELWRQAVYATLVMGGALIGLRYGIPGVAAGVGVAILYMFVAMGQLALRATATPWRVYWRVQIGALIITAITGVVAIATRFLLEVYQVSSMAITLGVLASAAVPWGVSMLWTLGAPDLDSLRATLPAWLVRFVNALRKSSGSSLGSRDRPVTDLERISTEPSTGRRPPRSSRGSPSETEFRPRGAGETT